MILSKAELITRCNKNPPLVTSFIDQIEQIQPNSIELTLDSVHEFAGQHPGILDFDNSKRFIPDTFELLYSGLRGEKAHPL